jgi:hypothetical protein
LRGDKIRLEFKQNLGEISVPCHGIELFRSELSHSLIDTNQDYLADFVPDRKPRNCRTISDLHSLLRQVRMDLLNAKRAFVDEIKERRCD